MYNPYWRAKIALIIYDSGLHVASSKNYKTCQFCIFILPLKAVNHSSMICDVIHIFLLDLHSTGSFRMSRFRKHLGFAALPITKGFSISPDIKPHRKTFNLSLQSFPPEHFSPFRQNDLFGSARKNRPVSSFSHYRKQNSVECMGCLKFFQTMLSGRLEIFRIKDYFDFRFHVRQFPFNPGYLTSVSAPKSRDIKIFLFKTNSAP